MVLKLQSSFLGSFAQSQGLFTSVSANPALHLNSQAFQMAIPQMQTQFKTLTQTQVDSWIESSEYQNWCGRLPDNQQAKLKSLTPALLNELQLATLRIEALQNEFLNRFTQKQLSENGWDQLYEFYLQSHKIVFEDLFRPDRFYTASQLEIQKERLELLNQNLLDLALILSASLKEEYNEKKAKKITQKVRSRRTKTDDSDENTDLQPHALIGKKFQSLVNKLYKKFGNLNLWPHQKEALEAIEDQFLAGEISPAFQNNEFLVQMPTGTGKTRVLAGCIPMAKRNGWFVTNQNRKGKVILTTHLTTINEQNSQKFKELFDGDFTISQYNADTKDLSGDVILVSLPTFAALTSTYKMNDFLEEHPQWKSYRKSEQKQAYEAAKLKKAQDLFLQQLQNKNDNKAIIDMLLVDEMHHDGASTWQAFENTLKLQNENLKIVKVSATPRPDQRRLVRFVKTVMQMFKNHVTPEVHLVSQKVEGVIENLRTSKKTGDFVLNSLSGIKNQKFIIQAIQAVAEYGYLRKTQDERKVMASVLGFGIDREHAELQAKAYAEYFGTKQAEDSKNLTGRRLEFVGSKIKIKDLEAKLQKVKDGELDALVAVVDGGTKKVVFKKIIEAHKNGLIEALFSCKKLEEGFDCPWARIALLNRPTLSIIQKLQEFGRILRSQADEVKDGVIQNVPYRIVIDMIYRVSGASADC